MLSFFNYSPNILLIRSNITVCLTDDVFLMWLYVKLWNWVSLHSVWNLTQPIGFFVFYERLMCMFTLPTYPLSLGLSKCLILFYLLKSRTISEAKLLPILPLRKLSSWIMGLGYWPKLDWDDNSLLREKFNFHDDKNLQIKKKHQTTVLGSSIYWLVDYGRNGVIK